MTGLAFLRGICEGKREPTPWEATYQQQQKNHQNWKDLQDAEKSAAGLRMEKQRER